MSSRYLSRAHFSKLRRAALFKMVLLVVSFVTTTVDAVLTSVNVRTNSPLEEADVTKL